MNYVKDLRDLLGNKIMPINSCEREPLFNIIYIRRIQFNFDIYLLILNLSFGPASIYYNIF